MVDGLGKQQCNLFTVLLVDQFEYFMANQSNMCCSLVAVFRSAVITNVHVHAIRVRVVPMLTVSTEYIYIYPCCTQLEM